MARTTGCLCRVPLHETAVPAFGRNDELLKWCADHGVDLDTDHMGRLSVSMEDAYRLRRESDEQARKSAEEQAVKAAKLAGQIREAQQRRQDVFSTTYTKAISRGRHSSQAIHEAQEAVTKAERRLDPQISTQLGLVQIPQVYPPGVGQVTAQYDTDLEDAS